MTRISFEATEKSKFIMTCTRLHKVFWSNVCYQLHQEVVMEGIKEAGKMRGKGRSRLREQEVERSVPISLSRKLNEVSPLASRS